MSTIKSDDDRHFENSFPEFSPENCRDILDDSMKNLHTDFVQSLETRLVELIRTLGEGLRHEIDWNDTSVYTGVSGYILLYMKLAETLEDERYTEKALTLAENMQSLKGRRVSFLCGDAGPLALAAVLYKSRKAQEQQSRVCVEKLIGLKCDILNINSELPDELLYGRVGYLFSLLYCQEKLGKEVIPDGLIRSVIDTILISGCNLSKKEKSQSPLQFQWHGKHYLGAAHGTVGILFMLLQIKDRLTQKELTELVKPSVDYLASQLFSSGNLPSSLGNDTDRLVHWCHGAPGAVFLFTKAHEVFNDDSYLLIARHSADVVWQRGLLRKGFGLCHGVAGNAYCFLYMFKITQESEFLYRACQFGRWCQDYKTESCNIPDRPFSLFEGLAGNVHFLADLLNPQLAKFPAFEL